MKNSIFALLIGVPSVVFAMNPEAQFQELISAAKRGDLATVEKHSTALNDRTSDNQALLAAVLRGEAKVVHFFLSKGRGPIWKGLLLEQAMSDEPRYQAKGLILAAASHGHQKMVDYLGPEKFKDVYSSVQDLTEWLLVPSDSDPTVPSDSDPTVPSDSDPTAFQAQRALNLTFQDPTDESKRRFRALLQVMLRKRNTQPLSEVGQEIILDRPELLKSFLDEVGRVVTKGAVVLYDLVPVVETWYELAASSPDQLVKCKNKIRSVKDTSTAEARVVAEFLSFLKETILVQRLKNAEFRGLTKDSDPKTRQRLLELAEDPTIHGSLLDNTLDMIEERLTQPDDGHREFALQLGRKLIHPHTREDKQAAFIGRMKLGSEVLIFFLLSENYPLPDHQSQWNTVLNYRDQLNLKTSDADTKTRGALQKAIRTHGIEKIREGAPELLAPLAGIVWDYSGLSLKSNVEPN